jgi:hypothetical protein
MRFAAIFGFLLLSPALCSAQEGDFLPCRTILLSASNGPETDSPVTPRWGIPTYTLGTWSLAFGNNPGGMEFEYAWNQLSTYPAGQLYGSLLVSWAHILNTAFGSVFSDLYVATVANRHAPVETQASALFSRLPSISDFLRELAVGTQVGNRALTPEDLAKIDRAMLLKLQDGLSAVSDDLHEPQELDALFSEEIGAALEQGLELQIRNVGADDHHYVLRLNLSEFPTLPECFQSQPHAAIYAANGELLGAGVALPSEIVTELNLELRRAQEKVERALQRLQTVPAQFRQ